MSKLSPRKLVKPESTLIEQTALAFATTFYEAGKSSGLTSKYKTHKAYAARHINEFIPLAVNYLMDMVANPQTPEEMRLAIYDCFLERANDQELSQTIPVFDNPFAKDFVSDKVVPQKPLVGNSPKKIEDLPIGMMLFEGHKTDG